jgi:hypothetical protein
MRDLKTDLINGPTELEISLNSASSNGKEIPLLFHFMLLRRLNQLKLTKIWIKNSKDMPENSA